jgi:lysophospholipase L1-like esterase
VSFLLATPVTFLALGICALAQIVTTSVTDTIYSANGQFAKGSVVVTWPAFTTAAGQSVAAGSTSATIGSDGVLTLTLTPNAGATPIGTYYTAVYHLSNGSVNREYWVVPASSAPVHISAIRSTVLPTSVAMQTVSKSYVDTAIAAAVSGNPLEGTNPYVLKAGDTMTGPLTLSGDPTSSTQAASKNYVDTNISAVASGLAQKVATLPSSTQTVAQPTGTQLEVNRQNGVMYASQYQTGRGDNGIANAVTSPDCASGCEIKAAQNYSSPENYAPSTWPSGTHLEDNRGGARRDSYTDPENILSPGAEAGQIVSVTSTRGGAAVHQLTTVGAPSSAGITIEHKALAGGSNQFPEGIGTIPYFKSTYSALTLNGMYNTQGQHVLAPSEVHCYGVGDCLIGSQFLYASGGQRDSADEGAHPYDLQIREDPRVFIGTCGSGCTPGSTSVTINPTAAPGTQGDGRFLINTAPSKLISTGSITGRDTTTPHASALFTGTGFPLSTFFRVAAPIPSQAHDMAPGNVTVAIATTGLPSGYSSNTAAAPSTSGVACVADPLVPAGPVNDFETATYTVVDGSHLQLNLNKAHFLNATVAIGGLCGYGLEQTVDTTSGIRQVFPVIGSYSPTALMYAGSSTEVVGRMDSPSAFVNVSLNITSAARSNNTVTLTTAGNMPYDLNGLSVRVAGLTDSSYNGTFTVTTTGGNTLTYAQSGANSTSSGGTVSVQTGGYVLYPMAEVLSVMNPATRLVDGQMTLAPNTVNWSASDTVEQPHFYQEKVGPDIEFIGQYVPRPTLEQNAGIQYEGNNGSGLRGWTINNLSPASNYFGNGGTHIPPDIAYLSKGIWKTTFDAQAGEQSVFNLHCNSHGCGKWNSSYNLFQLDSNAGIDVVSFNPLTSALALSMRGTAYSFTPQALNAATINATTINATTLNGAVAAAQLPVFRASGASHAQGAVPDPGATAGATRYLREDGTWATPAGTLAGGSSVGSVLSATATADYDFLQGSGSVLTDKSGSNNHGALGTGAQAPSWTTQGLYLPGGANVSLPAALNGTRSFIAAIYINPIGTGTQSEPINFPAIATSSLGASGLNLTLLYNGYNSAFSPSIFYSSGDLVTSTSIRISGFHVLAWTLGSSTDGTVDHLYIDGAEVGSYLTQSASAGRQGSGNLFLGASQAAPWMGNVNQTMYRVLAYPSALSASDVKSASEIVRNDVASRGVAVSPVATPLGRPLIQTIGDSITSGLGVATPWPSLLSTTDTSYALKNWGIPGIRVMEVLGSEPNRAALSCKTSVGAPSIAIVFLGTNDMNVYDSATSVSSVFADLEGEVQVLKRAGCTVFVGTMLSRTGANTNGAGATLDSLKDQYDAMITQKARLIGAEGIVDFAANPLLGADGAYTNPTYFQADGVHPNQTGHQLLASAASNTLNYYFGYSLSNPNVVTASTYTMASGDGAVTATPTTNAAWTLPDCVGPSGATYTITNMQSAYSLTIQGQTGQPINGLTTPVTVPANSTVTLHDVPNPKNVSSCHWVM